MNKSIVIIISVAIAAAFIALVLYGLRHGRGQPTVRELPSKPMLTVAHKKQSLNLAGGLKPELFGEVAPLKIDLIYQATILPWPEKLTPEIEVRAFHDEEQIYFLLTWKDATEDRGHTPSKFSDGCAIMFPLGLKAKPASLMMGFLGRSDIWHWKANHDRQYWEASAVEQERVYSDRYYPFEDSETLPVSEPKIKSAVTDLAAIRVGTLTRKENQIVQGRGLWTNGQWQVVFQRALFPTNSEWDAVFSPAASNSVCAFAVWNGSSSDRGGRKSISDFVELRLE